MSLKKGLVAAAMLALPAVAQAQPVSGLYIAGGAGGNYRMDSDLNVQGFGFPAGGAFGSGRELRTRFGWVGVGSIGFGFGNGIRAEIEGNYRDNSVERVTGAFTAGGTIRQYGVMGNAFYDFSLARFGVTPRFMPYIGVGAGYAWTDFDKVRASIPGVGFRDEFRANERDGNFAYQAIVGTAIGLSDVLPGLALTAEYRFFGTLEPRIDGTVTRITNVATTSSGRIESDNYNHSFLLGVRYAFNAPRPAAVVAAPAAAAPAPARTFLVFFDWDRADLTDRARQIIGEAATNVRNVRSTRIEVAGHADRSGAPDYNQRLSQRRADAVAAELVRRGVARNEITIQAFGETRPLVPTADGVREPQNRRVEIVLR